MSRQAKHWHEPGEEDATRTDTGTAAVKRKKALGQDWTKCQTQEEGCQRGSRERPLQKPVTAAPPAQQREEMPWAATAKGLVQNQDSPKWRQNPRTLPAHIILPAPWLQTPGVVGMNCACLDLLLWAVLTAPALPLWIHHHICLQKPCRPRCFQPVSEQGGH